VPEDFRSKRMETSEGRGLARSAWERWVSVVDWAVGPVIDPVASRIGANMAADLFGFWLTWHLEGGFAGLERLGMGRTTIFRKIKRFREVTGMHPDEFEIPGVSIDLAAYLAAGRGAARGVS
jgi:hypothetical protein